jgi:hypothetical protein
MTSAARLVLSLPLLAWLACAQATANDRAPNVEVEIGQGLVCDTQRQAERFVALFDGNAEAAVSLVNSEEQDPSACVIATVAYVTGAEVVSTLRNRSGAYRVVRILVLGVVTAQGLQAAQPSPFYSIAKIDEREA